MDIIWNDLMSKLAIMNKRSLFMADNDLEDIMCFVAYDSSVVFSAFLRSLAIQTFS